MMGVSSMESKIVEGKAERCNRSGLFVQSRSSLFGLQPSTHFLQCFPFCLVDLSIAC